MIIRARRQSFTTVTVMASSLCLAAVFWLCADQAAASASVGQNEPTGAQTLSAPASGLTFSSGKTSSGWLPFEYFDGTRIFIPAEINGHAALVLLDSGASETVLDRRFSSEIGLVPEGDLVGQGAGGSTAYSVVQGVDLKVGDLRWLGGTAVAIDLTAVARQVGHPMPVVLGGEMFRGAIVEIDFAARRIAFHSPTTYVPPENVIFVPLTPAGENQAVSATVEGRPARLLFDLGNAGAVDLFPRFWEQPIFTGERRIASTYVGGAGGMSEQHITMVNEMNIGGATLNDLPARLENRQSSQDAASDLLDGNVGMGVLSRFHLIIDFPHQQVGFAPPIDTVTPFRVNHSGLTVQPTGPGSTVLHVATGSPAALAGVVAGNVIERVEPNDPSAVPMGGDWLYGPIGEIVRLHLSDGRVATLTLARYF